MANDDRCVFCGKTLNAFSSTSVQCGNTYQLSCRNCAKELNALGDIDRCRRALLRGLADQPEKLRERIEINAKAEERRPKCLRCGGKMMFMEEQHFDNTPHSKSYFRSFDMIPAWCVSCGRYEFFNPAVIRKDPFLAHLLAKDTWDHEK